MNGIDQISAEGQMYDILAPEVVNDYVEKVGKPCQNPYGYSAGSLMLAKDTEGVQRLYKVTQAINNGQDILEGTNCEKRKLGECFDDVDDEIDSVKQALQQEVLHFSGVACAATTGNFATVSNAAITADHVVIECSFSKPTAITTDVTWTTATDSLVLNGTCADATCTATITIAKKGN